MTTISGSWAGVDEDGIPADVGKGFLGCRLCAPSRTPGMSCARVFFKVLLDFAI
jgi:hypothetical protein